MSSFSTALIFKDNNPFRFHFKDPNLDKKKAAQYISPEKRKLIKDYL
jgi:hypothetical protein